MDYNLQLKLSAVGEVVNVNAANTLVNPDEAGSVQPDRVGGHSGPRHLGSGTFLAGFGQRSARLALRRQRGSAPARLGVSDPICRRWHSLTDNRSPSFGPEIEAEDVDSLTIYTAGFPAEYGRKMGGVVEVNTLQDRSRLSRRKRFSRRQL